MHFRRTFKATHDDRADSDHVGRGLPRPGFRRCATLIAAGVLLASGTVAAKPAHPRAAEEEFGADVELAPFVVRGDQLTISIHARSARDRKYAEGFAEEVVKVVYDGVTERTGKGLVIIGAKGEPHPMTVFRTFQELAAAGELDPEVAAMSGALSSFLEGWKASLHNGHPEDADDCGDLDFDFENVLQALPLPLEGVGAKLYQIAWAEHFDEARLTARLRSLKPEELKRDLFVHFDWVFYLPPRGALDRVLDDIIAQALRQSDMGFFTRAAARTALVVAKPFIRRAVEGMRKGVLFMTVVRAQTDYEDAEVSELVDAYVEALMPGSSIKGHGSGHERAVWAVRDAREQLAEGTPVAGDAADPEDDRLTFGKLITTGPFVERDAAD